MSHSKSEKVKVLALLCGFTLLWASLPQSGAVGIVSTSSTTKEHVSATNQSPTLCDIFCGNATSQVRGRSYFLSFLNWFGFQITLALNRWSVHVWNHLFEPDGMLGFIWRLFCLHNVLQYARTWVVYTACAIKALCFSCYSCDAWRKLTPSRSKRFFFCIFLN